MTVTLRLVTVPLWAVVFSHTNELAAIAVALKEVTTDPVVTDVVVVPPVTASVPAALRSVPKRIVHVTLGLADPVRIAVIFVIVKATGVKNTVISSAAPGEETNTDFEKEGSLALPIAPNKTLIRLTP